MTDRLGYRLKLGIVIPSTNSIVQPETDDMRPRGVTNHIGRIHIPDLPLTNDAELEQTMTAIRPDLYGAVDREMSCKPAHLIMAMSIPTFGAAWRARPTCKSGCRRGPASACRLARSPV